MAEHALRALAKVIRSKNSGPFELTFDVMFDDAACYEAVKASGAITRDVLGALYGVADNHIVTFQFFDPALAFKFTIRRPRPQGSIGETDTFGAQQHAPLLTLMIPLLDYMSKQELGFHTDTADVVALMVLRAAKFGGLSLIASSVAIRNEIARTRPDLLEVLYAPFYWSWKGQQGPGDAPYYEQPIYTNHDGKFAARDIKTHIFSAHQDHPELGDLAPAQMEAMQLVNTLARDPRFHFSMMFEPGDIQLLNNHVTYHSRTAFEDYEETDRKRHLLRMWLSVANSRALSPAMAPIYRDQRGGAVRGGFRSRTGAHSFATVAAKD